MNRMESLKDLWGFFQVRKKYWLLPILLFLLLLGGLVALASGPSVAPFLYTLF